MDDLFFKGFWRMDWGLGNPNKTAVLIATLMVGVWVLAYVRKWGFWVALGLFTGLGVALVHTFSRGGLIAVFAGLVPVLVMASRPWKWKQIAGVVVAVWVIVGASIYLQAHARYTQGITQEDRSISNRLKLWQAVPMMMRDTPSGWGIGNSGKAYMEWYQPLDQHERYRTLVNSHLTWLVEFGWVGRFMYVCGWLGVFVICLPDKRSRWLSVPFGIWLAFGVGAFFSSVAESPWLWIIPGIFLLAALAWRIRNNIWPPRGMGLVPPVAAGLVLLLVSALAQESDVYRDGVAIYLGKGSTGIWIVSDKKVLGEGQGRALRAFKEKREQDNKWNRVGIVEDLEHLPEVTDADVLLAGKFDTTENHFEKIAKANSILLVNPMVFPQEMQGIHAFQDKVKVMIGDFAQSSTAHAWEADFHTQRLSGAGDFIPDWPERLLKLEE